mmetsp:Transcript_8217/g.23514  ORF Transcript_8217/g.23514 Transcript_8217/m.23514 type:complete len:201 (+) Transcript_8217:2599-3201(+)
MEVVMKDLRKSTGVPKRFRSRMPSGGKYSSQCRGSVKGTMSSSLMPMAFMISHWKAASPVFARIFFATLGFPGAPPFFSLPLGSLGAASMEISSLSLPSGHSLPSARMARTLKTLLPLPTGAMHFTLYPASFNSSALGAGTIATSLKSPWSTLARTLNSFSAFLPVEEGALKTSSTLSSVIWIWSSLLATGCGFPGGNTG